MIPAENQPSVSQSQSVSDCLYMCPWRTKPVIRVNFVKLRFMHHLKAEYIIFPLMYDRTIFENLEYEGAKKSKY